MENTHPAAFQTVVLESQNLCAPTKAHRLPPSAADLLLAQTLWVQSTVHTQAPHWSQRPVVFVFLPHLRVNQVFVMMG